MQKMQNLLLLIWQRFPQATKQQNATNAKIACFWLAFCLLFACFVLAFC
jgi:hypothetical protein